MNAKVTIIVPAFNSVETIERTIDSILEQDYPNKEIIVVDDGSTDSTLAQLETYGDKIRLLQQKNMGPSAARNRGMKFTTGRYVAFLDSDDYWLPGFISHCIDALDAAPDAIAVSVMTKAIHWSSREIIIPAVPPDTGPHGEVLGFFSYWGRHDHIRTGSVMLNIEKFDNRPLFREELRNSEDLEYWGYLATMGEWLYIPEILLVTDGTHHSQTMSWKEKNMMRRTASPSVEEWQSRLLPRLKESDLEGFYVLRGRIARNLTHTKLLIGDDRVAREIVKNYGEDFPATRLNSLIVMLAGWGPISWSLLANLLRIRETLKSAYLTVRK